MSDINVAIMEARRPMIHYVKILPEYFDAVQNLEKNFELRKDDRNYQVGDFITLNEWKDGVYTGRQAGAYKISYILRNCPEYGLKDGYCIIGLKEQKMCSNGQPCTHPNCKKCGTTHFMSECDYLKEQKHDR